MQFSDPAPDVSLHRPQVSNGSIRAGGMEGDLAPKPTGTALKASRKPFKL
jgi:hypothetical protein